MAQRLFDTGKVPIFIDGYAPKIEKRQNEDVSCLTVNCRIQPFDAKRAASLDNGVGGDSNIRPTTFSLNNGDPKPHFTRHDFKLAGLPSQNLVIFPSPDTDESRVALTQARIHGCYIRTQKDVNALAMCFKATFGPVGRDELELVHSLFRRQTFVTFEEGELTFDIADDDEAGEDEPVQQHAQKPMFDDHGGETPAADASSEKPDADGDSEVGDGEPHERVNRPLHTHQTKKKNTRRGRR